MNEEHTGQQKARRDRLTIIQTIFTVLTPLVARSHAAVQGVVELTTPFLPLESPGLLVRKTPFRDNAGQLNPARFWDRRDTRV